MSVKLFVILLFEVDITKVLLDLKYLHNPKQTCEVSSLFGGLIFLITFVTFFKVIPLLKGRYSWSMLHSN